MVCFVAIFSKFLYGLQFRTCVISTSQKGISLFSLFNYDLKTALSFLNNIRLLDQVGVLGCEQNSTRRFIYNCSKHFYQFLTYRKNILHFFSLIYIESLKKNPKYLSYFLCLISYVSTVNYPKSEFMYNYPEYHSSEMFDKKLNKILYTFMLKFLTYMLLINYFSDSDL